MKNKNFYLTLGVFVILIFIAFFSFQKTETKNIDADNLEELEAKFSLLNKARTNFCAGPEIVSVVDSERLQGSCCSAMDFHRYTEQIEGLKKFSYIEEVPKDPYDIPKEWADRFIEYYQTNLTFEQQKIYDDASEISDEKGPCCCKCWRWYAYGGLAKYLIINYNFTAEQIAEVWDLSDGCGGSGHGHG
jgi:hypothetical protein